MVAVLLAVTGLAACNRSSHAHQPVEGGDLVLAAEQEPKCTDWLGTCDQGSEWAYWVLGAQTLPRAFDVLPDSTYVPGAVLEGAPDVSPGPPVTITYRIKPSAVWSDGQPITSADFRYTWQQVVSGPDVFDTTGYDRIAAIDASDPKVAIVTLKSPLGAYRDLFSAFYGILPSHILAGRDRGAAMRDGYSWSGGPWKLAFWHKGQDLMLVPNPTYWGPRPHVRSVTFRFLTDPTAEITALATGTVDGGYPQPQPALFDGLRRAPFLTYAVNDGTSFEAIWINTEHGALRDALVRQALAYATDREAIGHRLVQVVEPHASVLQSTVAPADKAETSPAFAKYGYNPSRTAQIMKADGWTKGADGIWERGGLRASFVFRTTSGNPARMLVQQLLESDWRAAGFDITLDDEEASTLFQTALPKGDFDLATFTFSTTPDGGQCRLWCSDQIPSVDNGFTGQNYTRISSPELDADWGVVDREMDPLARAVDIKSAEADLADEVPVIPLYPRLSAVVMNKAVRGPVGDDFILGPFWNMEQWYLTPAAAKSSHRPLGT